MPTTDLPNDEIASRADEPRATTVSVDTAPRLASDLDVKKDHWLNTFVQQIMDDMKDTSGEGFSVDKLKSSFSKILNQNLRDLDGAELSRVMNIGQEIMAQTFNDVASMPGFDHLKSMAVRFANWSGLWSLNQGPIRELNGIRVDANGKAVDENGDPIDDDVEDLRDALASAERWDKQESTEFSGMTNAEVLDVMRYMDEHSDEMADDAVATGKINASQKDAYQKYIKLRRQNEEYKRTHNGQDDPSLKPQIEASENTNPTFKPTFSTQLTDENTRKLTVAEKSAKQTVGSEDYIRQRSTLSETEHLEKIHPDFRRAFDDQTIGSKDVSGIVSNENGTATTSSNTSVVATRANLSDQSLNTVFNQVSPNAAANSQNDLPQNQKLALAETTPRAEISSSGASFGMM